MPLHEPDRLVRLAGLLLARDPWLRSYVSTRVRLDPEAGPQALVVATDPFRDDVIAAVQRALAPFEVAVVHDPQDPPRHPYLGLTREQAQAFAKAHGERLIVLEDLPGAASDGKSDPFRVVVRLDQAGRVARDYWV